LGPSIVNSGLDPKNLPEGSKQAMSFGSGGSSKNKVWRDIWGAGQGVGSIREIATVADVVAQTHARVSRRHAGPVAALLRDAEAERGRVRRWIGDADP
jgi:nitronate monooxygenase